MARPVPQVVVFSTLFPAPLQPQAGLFIRERMFRVAAFLPITVVSPVPWFPFQWIVRLWQPGFRPQAPAREMQAGIEILRPRFLSFPGLFKRLDGFFLALGALPTLRALRREGRLDVLDAHFGYPDGYAATLLGRWLGVPATVTLRGSEERHARAASLRKRLTQALRRAERVFAVADALKRLAVSLGIADEKVRVVGNGVDLERFRAIARGEARQRLDLPREARVLISVGGLVERKGFHRVIAALPRLHERFPDLHYLIVGGPSPEGDIGAELRAQVEALGLGRMVRFLGALPPGELNIPLSAADLFVLATRNEGRANVLLEAMACGVPVVATDVGGNSEVVCRDEVGFLVPFDDTDALIAAVVRALEKSWDRDAIVGHARGHDWSRCVDVIVQEIRLIHDRQ